MASESPFFLTKVECPVCRTINEFETIKVGAYVEEEHDTDFCPRGRTWRNSRYEIFNPLLFFMATCENCFYTREFNQAFKDWKNDTSFRTYRLKHVQARHLEALAVDGSLVKMLATAYNPREAPFATAVVKFLLGIYDELLLEHPRKLDLGRFFLRIGWLFRECSGNPGGAVNKTAHFAKDIEKAYFQLTRSQDSFLNNFQTISSLIDQQFTYSNGAIAQNGEYQSVYTSFQASLQRFAELKTQLQELVSGMAGSVEQNSCLLAASPFKDGQGTVAVGSSTSLGSFLSAAKAKWSYVPQNEPEALLYAIEFYREALESGREIQPGNQQIQATYLIAELSRRVGRFVEAKQYFNNTIKYGQQFIFENRSDQTRTALARRIVELALEQGKQNLASVQSL